MDFYADSGEGFAGKVSFLGLYEGDDAIFGGMNGEVFRHIGTWACDFRGTSLAN